MSCEEWIGGLHRAKSFAPHEFRKSKVKPLWAWWYSPRGAATRVYDTMELVRPVINDRDSPEVKEQKLKLGGLIDRIMVERHGVPGAPAGKQIEPANDLLSDHVDGLPWIHDDDITHVS